MKNNKEAQALRSNLEIFGRPSGKYSRSIYDAATQYLKLLEGSHVLVPVEPTAEMLTAVGTMEGYDGAYGSADNDHIEWYTAMIQAAQEGQ